MYCPVGGILFYSSGQEYLGADTTIKWDHNCATCGLEELYWDINDYFECQEELFIPSVRYDPAGRAVLCETS